MIDDWKQMSEMSLNIHQQLLSDWTEAAEEEVVIHSRTLYSEYYNALVPRLAVELQLLQKSTLTARRDQFGPRRKLCSENVKNILLFFL